MSNIMNNSPEGRLRRRPGRGLNDQASTRQVSTQDQAVPAPELTRPTVQPGPLPQIPKQQTTGTKTVILAPPTDRLKRR